MERGIETADLQQLGIVLPDRMHGGESEWLVKARERNQRGEVVEHFLIDAYGAIVGFAAMNDAMADGNEVLRVGYAMAHPYQQRCQDGLVTTRGDLRDFQRVEDRVPLAVVRFEPTEVQITPPPKPEPKIIISSPKTNP